VASLISRRNTSKNPLCFSTDIEIPSNIGIHPQRVPVRLKTRADPLGFETARPGHPLKQQITVSVLTALSWSVFFDVQIDTFRWCLGFKMVAFLKSLPAVSNGRIQSRSSVVFRLSLGGFRALFLPFRGFWDADLRTRFARAPRVRALWPIHLQSAKTPPQNPSKSTEMRRNRPRTRHIHCV